MSELIHRLLNEADLCQNEGAKDIAKLLNEAAHALQQLRAENDKLRDGLKSMVMRDITRRGVPEESQLPEESK